METKIGIEDVWNERIHTARTVGLEPLVEAVMGRWFSPGFADANPEQFARSRATLLGTDARGYAAVCAAIRDADFRGDVAAIDVPTLVIAGTLDLAATVDQSRWLHEQIAGSQFVELHAAHLGNLDRPEEFTAILGSFLESV